MRLATIPFCQFCAAIVLAFAAQTHGAPPTLEPAPALRIVSIEIDSKRAREVGNVTMRELPEREEKITTLSVDSVVRRGSVIRTPAGAAMTMKSVNGALIRLEANSELYVDAVIASGEIYEIGRGVAQFETAQAQPFFMLKHGAIAASAQGAKFRAEVMASRPGVLFAVERGAIEIEETVRLVDAARNRRIAVPESRALEAGQSYFASDDVAKRKEVRFDNVSEAGKHYAGELQQAEIANDRIRRQTVLRHAILMASGFRQTGEAIRHHGQWSTSADENPYHQLMTADAIAQACDAEANNACTAKYHESALTAAEQLYPDGLHFRVIKIRKAIAAWHGNVGEAARIESYAALLPRLETRMRFNTDTPAKLHKQCVIKYPLSMRQWGIQGDGAVSVMITAEGKATDARVVKSPHPAFENAIVKCVLASEFKPATRDGKPVASRSVVPFKFRFDDLPNAPMTNRDAAFAFPKRPHPELPADLQYDEPPVINVAAPVVYPRDRVINDVTGHAKLALVLNDKGQIRTISILESTHPDFGEATRAMLQAWEFSPAMKNKKPVPTAFVYEQRFHWDERDTGMNDDSRKLLDALASKSSDIAEVDALDAAPMALYRPSPVDPRPPKVGEEPVEEVVIEFFIDPEGNVQLPKIVAAKDMALGWAAATAVKRWIFEVPTIKGRPVFARRELRFAFK